MKLEEFPTDDNGQEMDSLNGVNDVLTEIAGKALDLVMLNAKP